jgi:hypothetical protein
MKRFDDDMLLACATTVVIHLTVDETGTGVFDIVIFSVLRNWDIGSTGLHLYATRQ